MRYRIRTFLTLGLVLSLGSVGHTFIGGVQHNDPRPGSAKATYKFKVAKSSSKGKLTFNSKKTEFYAMLGFGEGVSFTVQAEIPTDPFFGFRLTTPGLNATDTPTRFKATYANADDDAPNRPAQINFSLGNEANVINDSLSGATKAKDPVPVDGTIVAQSVKMRVNLKGKQIDTSTFVRGRVKYTIKGVIEGGADDGKAFKATMSAKLKDLLLETEL